MKIEIETNDIKEYEKIIKYISHNNIDCMINNNFDEVQKKTINLNTLMQIREKALIAHMGKEKYKLLSEYDDILRRSRFMYNKNIWGNLIIEGNDFIIVDKFCEDVGIKAGRGFSTMFLHLINYYKNNKIKMSKENEK